MSSSDSINSFYVGIIKYALIGLFTVSIYISSLWFLNSYADFNYILSVSLAYFLSSIFHFFANKRFTFINLNDLNLLQIFRYIILLILNYIITILVVNVAVEIMHYSVFISVIISLFFTIISGYLLGKYWIFVIDKDDK